MANGVALAVGPWASYLTFLIMPQFPHAKTTSPQGLLKGMMRLFTIKDLSVWHAEGVQEWVLPIGRVRF